MSLEKAGSDKTNTEKNKYPPLKFAHFPLSFVTDSTDDAAVLTTPTGIITDWNRSAQKIFGFTGNMVTGKPLWQFAPSDRQHDFMEGVDRINKGEHLVQFELEWTDKNGKKKYRSLSIAPILGPGKKLMGIITLARDTTERKKAEFNQERHRVFLDNIKDACFEFNLKGKCTFCNEAAHQMLGYSREEYMNLSHRQRYRTKSAADSAYQIYNNIFQTGTMDTRFESEMLCKDGSVITVEMVVSPIFNNQNVITGFRGVGRDITARKKGQMELERYRNFVESVDEGCFETDLAGTLVFVNQAASRIIGYPREKIIGMNYRQYTQPPEIEKIKQAFNQVYRTGTSVTIENHEVVDYHGNTRNQEVFVSLMRNGQGKPVGFRGTNRDITKNKKIQEALRLSEERYHNMFEYNKAVMLLIDPDTARIIDANLSACFYYGYQKEELLAKKMTEINTASPEEIQEEMNRARLEERSHFYFNHRLASGIIRPVEVFSGPLEIGGKQLLYSIIHDITERRKAEDELLRSEEKYRTIIQNMVDAYFESDLDGRFTFANENTCSTLGYSLDELVHFDYRKFTTPETGEKVREVYQRTLQTGTPTTLVDYEIICRDGTILTHQLNVGLMRDAAGNPIGFRSVSRDVTRRRKAEEELRRSEEKYRTILENMMEGYFESDLGGHMTFVNDAGCAMIGYTKEEAYRLHYSQYTTSASKKKLQNAFSHVFQTGIASKLGDYEVIHKDGGIRIHQLSIALLTDTSGEKIGFRAVARDVTERKETEEALRQSEERIRLIFNNIPVPTVVWKSKNDALILIEYNDAAMQYTGGRIIEFIGKTVEECYPRAPHIAMDMHQCFSLRTNIEKSFWFGFGETEENKYVTIKYAFVPPDNVIMHVSDMTAQKKAEEHLKHISIHDALTGLYNRFYSDAEITRISASRLRPVSFIVIDLNNLKNINDRFGHAAGDLYIKNTATLLKQTFRPEDMIARMGGDEFIIMLPSVDENTCSQMITRLQDNLALYNRAAGQPISFSAGISTAHTGDNIEALIAEADRRMYQEKARIKVAQKTAINEDTDSST